MKKKESRKRRKKTKRPAVSPRLTSHSLHECSSILSTASLPPLHPFPPCSRPVPVCLCLSVCLSVCLCIARLILSTDMPLCLCLPFALCTLVRKVSLPLWSVFDKVTLGCQCQGGIKTVNDEGEAGHLIVLTNQLPLSLSMPPKPRPCPSPL